VKKYERRIEMKKIINYIMEVLIITVFIMVIVLVADNILEGRNNATSNKDKENRITKIDENNNIINEKYITKANALKMIALSKEDKKNINVRDREIKFKDIKKEDWYDKYFNMAIVEGWYKPKGDMLYPLEPLVYNEAKHIMKYFNVDESNVNINLNKEGNISYSEWIKVYKTLITKSDNLQSNKFINIYVYATPAITGELSAWEVATDKGKYSFEGLNLDSYVDKRITVSVKGEEILYINSIDEENPQLTNAYVKKIDSKKGNICIYMGGASRVLNINNKMNISDGMIVDAKISSNNIISLNPKTNIKKGIVKKISSKELLIERDKIIPILENTMFYSEVGNLAMANYKNVIVGYDTCNMVFDKDDNLCSIIITKKAPLNIIRVAINNNDFSKLYHSNVKLTSDGDYDIYLNSKKISCKSGSEKDIKLKVGERAKVISKNNKIKILSINRGWGDSRFNPIYRGLLEIEKTKDGYLIVNEVDFEEYLYSVVPSEMPSSYGIEAAKVQAICARSYAFSQLYANRFSQYGAHVDDSTSCQVYNNVRETDNSIKAVNETKGLFLSYKGNIISANFFSTSCGVTSNSGEVWGNYLNKQFPSSSPEYMQSKFQYDKGNLKYDLSKENDFREFIQDNNIITYDSEFSWYRWNVTMTCKQIEKAINKEIPSRYKVVPKYIKTLDDNDIFRSREVDDIGELVDIFVYSRGESGIITELLIKGTKGVYKVSTEYNIRKLITPINYVEGEKEIAIIKNDGQKTYNMSILPSAFFIMNKKYDTNKRLKSITFIGGGYGHGAGMSQNGVKGMVDKGYNYAEILKHYYNGTSITKL
jgi:stage II sporulation protein D